MDFDDEIKLSILFWPICRPQGDRSVVCSFKISSALFRMLINIDDINVRPAFTDFNKELIPAISCSFHEAPVSEIIGGTMSIRSSILTRKRFFHCVEEMSYRPRKINAILPPLLLSSSLFRNFMVKTAIRLLGPYTIGLRF